MRVIARRPAAVAIGLVLALGSAAVAVPTASTAHAIPGFERFMYALGEVESGGSYTAYNATSGAYGKYQIIPSSWRAWALQVLGDASAPKTAANQEKVARYKVHEVWHYTKSFRLVAYWWLTGRINRDESSWSSYARSYVGKVMNLYAATGTTAVSSTARFQESYRYIGWSGTWALARHSAYAGDTVRWADRRGATATFTFTGNSVAWYGPKGPTRGKAWVYIDGKYARTVDLYSSSFRAVTRVFSTSWGAVGKHSIRIEVVGTAGRPVVAIDEFRITR